ncbi:MAG: major capsid protein [Lachnospiraceae bacterium]|nr:major capsid protein [Lachnospiraceae bacterium]
MESIFSKVSLPSIPVDLLSTLRIFFEKGSLQNKTLFEQLYVDRWFDYNLPQMGLTAEAIMASYKVRFMASVIGNDAATPLRPTDGFKTFTEEIPRLGHRFPMSADKLRKMLAVLEASSKRYTDQQKFNEVYKLLVGDVREAYLGCKDTVDHIILQALSNAGVAQFKPQLNNPDGRTFRIDYGMPERNKLKATKNWTKENAASINPFEELAEIKYEFENYGILFGEILMAPALYAWFINNPNVRRAIKGNDKSAQAVTPAELNAMLQQFDLPTITKINKRNAITKDGKRSETLINPYNDNVIVFKPAGKIGEVQPAFEDNAIIPEKDVEYVDAGNGIRVAKWQVGESSGQKAGEYTQASWRALPIITEIDGIVNYQVRGIE